MLCSEARSRWVLVELDCAMRWSCRSSLRSSPQRPGGLCQPGRSSDQRPARIFARTRPLVLPTRRWGLVESPLGHSLVLPNRTLVGGESRSACSAGLLTASLWWAGFGQRPLACGEVNGGTGCCRRTIGFGWVDSRSVTSVACLPCFFSIQPGPVTFAFWGSWINLYFG